MTCSPVVSQPDPFLSLLLSVLMTQTGVHCWWYIHIGSWECCSGMMMTLDLVGVVFVGPLAGFDSLGKVVGAGVGFWSVVAVAVGSCSDICNKREGISISSYSK